MLPKKTTRQSSRNCFGSSTDDGNLYTFRDVLAACEKDLEISPSSSKYEIANRITPRLVAKWKQCNPELVLIADTSIHKKVIREVTTSQDIRLKKLSKKQTDIFVDKLDKLFDLLVCQCPIIDCPSESCQLKNCPGVHADCSCERKDKIPLIELKFVRDQRTKVGHRGQMQMGSADKIEAKRQEKSCS